MSHLHRASCPALAARTVLPSSDGCPAEDARTYQKRNGEDQGDELGDVCGDVAQAEKAETRGDQGDDREQYCHAEHDSFTLGMAPSTGNGMAAARRAGTACCSGASSSTEKVRSISSNS